MVVAVRFIQKGGDMTGRGSPFEWRRPPPTRHKERKKQPLLTSLLKSDKKKDGGEKDEMQNLKKQFG